MLSYTQPKHYLSECVFRPSTALLVTYFFFFIDTASTEIYTLSLHDALPISLPAGHEYLHLHPSKKAGPGAAAIPRAEAGRDRKSTRLNSSHTVISYAVFCLKKKTENKPNDVCSVPSTS